MSITRNGSYFECWTVSDVVDHRRGKTFTQEENVRWSLATMNTAQAHWNVESMKSYFGGQFDRPLMNAALVVALAIGLTSEDMSENATRELGLDRIRIPVPCFPGDTVTARSTVLELAPHAGREDCGEMVYGIELRNQRSELVCELVRRVLLKRRDPWLERDARFLEQTKGQA